ncbi:hypothetical protein [Thiomicrospira microaerophila]|jgi:hypothetical protein|uniref:hypothetical protein n=1 Tax=Thiomicrospira microaerophila TaxID=406020 RepID=UPI0005CAF381|nr:hypothetical protein [Thiomicrospira microaerophila]
MHAIEFKANVVGEFLRIPNFEQFKNKHVRVVIEEDVDADQIETRALSNHSASLVEEWWVESEDEVWK